MSTDIQDDAKQQEQFWKRMAAMQNRAASALEKSTMVHPPLVYIGLGCVCLAFWALGTSCQVLTSQAWMTKQTMDHISFTAFGQLVDVAHGTFPSNQLVPLLFSWGVQLALIIGSIGIELPKKPALRYHLARTTCLSLIIANSCGDWTSSASYGFWGQCGFTAVIFFLTFVMMLFTIMAFMHAYHLIKAARTNKSTNA